MAKFLKFPVVAGLLVLALRCGEPLGPASAGWVRYAAFPESCRGITGLAVDGWRGDVSATAREVGKYVIWRYDGRGFAEDYVVPYGSGEAWLADVGYASGTFWAGGGKKGEGRDFPYLLRNLRRSGYEELPVATDRRGSLSAVYAVNDVECWFTVYDGYLQVINRRQGLLARYRDGVVTTFERLGEVTSAVYTDAKAAAAGKYVVYAVEAIGRGTRVGDVKVFITSDGGATWAEERLEFASPVGDELETVRAAYATGEALYLLVEFVNGYAGVIERRGTPGRGDYELTFCATQAPNFKWLNDLTAQDETLNPDRGLRALAVGYETSAYLDDGLWRLEEVSYPAEFKCTANAAYGGFWAAAQDTAFGGYELMYHP